MKAAEVPNTFASQSGNTVALFSTINWVDIVFVPTSAKRRIHLGLRAYKPRSLRTVSRINVQESVACVINTGDVTGAW